MTTIRITLQDAARTRAINDRIIGWSGAIHYAFFKYLLENPAVKDVLVLGVYHGRDLAFILDILEHNHPGRTLNLVGVDRFDNSPCLDWPESQRSGTWESTQRGVSPALHLAERNLGCPRDGLTLIKSDDSAYVSTTDQKFDVIYVDTSHDKASVVNVLRPMPRICRENTTIAGDDFVKSSATWGVEEAVEEMFTEYTLFGPQIWVSEAKFLRG